MYNIKLQQILYKIEKLDSKLKCVSFDVFDTLIHRKIAPPDQVMVPAAKTVVELLKNHEIIESVSDCLTARKIVTEQLMLS